MPEKIKELSPPRGCGRLFFRFPILLFRLGLGRLLGNRFLLLHHTGRVTGLPRTAALEVVHFDQEEGIYVVVAAFGEKTDWYRNVMKRPEVTIEVGGRKLEVRATRLDPEQGGEILLRFARAHPFEARFVSVLGYRVDGSDDDWRALGEELLFIQFAEKRSRN